MSGLLRKWLRRRTRPQFKQKLQIKASTTCIMSGDVRLLLCGRILFSLITTKAFLPPVLVSLLIDVMNMSRLKCYSHTATQSCLHLSSRDHQPDWRVEIIIIIVVIRHLQDAHARRLNNDKHFAAGNTAAFQGISAIMRYLTKLQLHLSGLLSVLVLTRLPLLKLLE